MSQTIEHHIPTNGIHLHVYEYSQTGEPVFFLHMIQGNAITWNGVLPFFTDQYRVFAIDLRGHGLSDQPDTGYDIPTLAEDLKGVLDALALDRVHLVGSSLGCYVATCFAGMYPDRVLSLAHSDGAMENHGGESGKFSDLGREQHLQRFDQPEPEFATLDEFLTTMRAHAPTYNDVYERTLVEGYATSIRRLDNGRLARKTKVSTALQLYAALYDLQLEPYYEKITCPILFLPADKHPRTEQKRAFLAKISATLPAPSKIAFIPGTTHIMVVEFYEELAREILVFYREIKSGYTSHTK